MGIFVVVITRGCAKVACYCIPEKLFSAFGDKANDCTFRGRKRDESSVCHLQQYFSINFAYHCIYKLIVFTGVGLNS